MFSENELKLYKGLKKHYDGETPDGRKVQIKATFKDSLTFKKTPDYYLGIKIFEDGTYEEMFNGQGKTIEEQYSHRKGFGETLLSFPNKKLHELSKSVPNKQKIRKRA